MPAGVTLEFTLPSGAVKTGRPEAVMAELSWLLDARFRRDEFRDSVARGMGQIFAQRLRGVLQGGNTGVDVGGPSLSPLTVSTKGHAKKLLSTGRLSNWHMLRPGVTGEVLFLFRGRASRSAGVRGEGPMLEQAAALQEYGTKVKVTAQMVRFFRAAALRDGWSRGFLRFREGDEIVVPPRPFFARTLRAIHGDVKQMILGRIIDDWKQVR